MHTTIGWVEQRGWVEAPYQFRDNDPKFPTVPDYVPPRKCRLSMKPDHIHMSRSNNALMIMGRINFS